MLEQVLMDFETSSPDLPLEVSLKIISRMLRLFLLFFLAIPTLIFKCENDLDRIPKRCDF